MPQFNVTPAQIDLCRARLEYFQSQLTKTVAGENDSYPIGASDHDWCVRYYKTEVAERTLLLALWEHLLDAGKPQATNDQNVVDQRPER